MSHNKNSPYQNSFFFEPLLHSPLTDFRYPEVTIREQLTAAVRRFKPTIVFTWHSSPQLLLQPGNGWDDLGFHPDHQAVGSIALATVMGPSAGTRLIFPDLLLAGLQPHGVSQIYLWQYQEFSHYFDITPTMEAKVAALAEHKSQYPNVDDLRVEVHMLGATAAGYIRAPGVTYAELFFQICMLTNCALAP